MTALDKPLNSLERTQLRVAEKAIDAGKTTFLQVGNALKVIQNGKLYRETHKTFQSYVEQRHDFKRAWAYRLIQQAEVAENLSSVLDKTETDALPSRQVEALSRLPGDQQADAYKDAADECGGTPTTEVMQNIVETYLADNEPYEEKPKRKKKPPKKAQKKDARIWGELEELLGKALNRTDELHRQYPNGSRKAAMLEHIKAAMKELAEWRKKAK